MRGNVVNRSIVLIMLIVSMASTACIADEINITRELSGWVIHQKFDLEHEFAESRAYKNSTEQFGGRQFDERELIVNCSNNALLVAIHWELWHLIDEERRIDVTLQFDSDAGETESWNITDDERYTYIRGKGVDKFIERASQHKMLQVSTIAGHEKLWAQYEIPEIKKIERIVRNLCVYDEDLVKTLMIPIH